MTYEQMRDNEQFAQLDGAISDFISRYKVNSVNPIAPRKTVILFPGGMASRLKRARTAYDPSLASYFYDVRWLDKSIAFGAALELRMANDIDRDQRIVIADGPVDFGLYFPPFVIGYVPYQGFIDWCDQQRIDWFIFGWDWRRRMEYTVDMFLNRFLPQFQARVQLECNADPLADFSLVGHSFGGMVVKLIVNQAAQAFVIQMNKAITVGSPFYGYAGHVHRYFEGDDSLIFYDRSSISRVVSSLQGGYTLLFLDEATYNIVGPQLGTDAYPLYDYPSRDAGDNSIADPYNPIDLATKFRYPQKYGFQPLELAHGRGIYQQVALDLVPAVAPKFYNIRGVQSKAGAVLNGTIYTQTWSRIPKSYNPNTSTPAVVDDSVGPGDGVIPAWSARLVSTPPANVRTLIGDFEHMNLMNEVQTHNELLQIL